MDPHALDTRQYRDLQARHDGGKTWWFTDCAEQEDPERTILGPDQMQWLQDGMIEAGGAEIQVDRTYVVPAGAPALHQA